MIDIAVLGYEIPFIRSSGLLFSPSERENFKARCVFIGNLEKKIYGCELERAWKKKVQPESFAKFNESIGIYKSPARTDEGGKLFKSLYPQSYADSKNFQLPR